MRTSKREQQASRFAAAENRISAPPRRARIWLLEDSPLQAEETLRAIAEQEVAHFTDGASLLEELSHSMPDMLVLDWELDGLTGIEVLRFVRESRDELTLPVLVLTGDESAIVEALGAGANDFAAKPCPPAVLRARVKTLLRVRSLSQRILDAEQERTDALERVYEAETRMYVALEAASIGTWELDPRTGSLQLDPASESIMALAAETTLAELETSLHPDDRIRLRETLARSLDPAQRAAFSLECRVRRGERERWIATAATALFDGETAVRLVGAVFDITERKLAQQTMEHDAIFRERFIAILAHDLRTPLTSLRLGSQLLTRRALAPEAAQEIGLRLDATTRRMERMIADLLDLTRARQGGGMPVVRASARLEEICRTVVQEIELSVPDRAIILECDGDTGGHWDASRLQQVVSNLVSNAIDYSPAQSRIRVNVRGGEQVLLEVHNESALIPPETLQTLFEPFRRGGPESAASARPRGLGLGLYIVAQIAQAHGGSVSARSEEGRGTTFSVSLPR